MHSTKEDIKKLDRLKKRSDFLYVQKISNDSKNKNETPPKSWAGKTLILQCAESEIGKTTRACFYSLYRCG